MTETCQACGQPSAELCPDGYDDDCCDAADHNHWEPGEFGECRIDRAHDATECDGYHLTLSDT